MEGVSDWDAPLNSSDESSPRPNRCSDVDVGDSSPASSNFSSCDGSDFDRYCSANSVLGSASICSSIGNYSGTGEENPLEGYNSRGKLLRSVWHECEYLSSDGGTETPRANCSYESSLAGLSVSSRLIHDATESSSSRYGICGDTENLPVSCYANGGIGDSEKQEDECALNENLWNRDSVTHLVLEVDRVTDLEANEDAFCPSKVSESDDSMLDYGTDNEGRIQFGKSSFKLVDKTKHEDENPLFMSLSTAFGSNDWNEFERDAEAGGLTSVSLHLDQSFQHKDEHVGRDFEEDVGDMAVASFEVKDPNVKTVGDGHYVSTINHEAQIFDILAQISSGKHSVLNRNEAESGDQTTKNLECASDHGLQNTLSESNEAKFLLYSLCDAAERKIEASVDEDKALKGLCETSEEKMNDESKLLVGTFTGCGAQALCYDTMNGARRQINRVELGMNSVNMPLNDIGDGFGTQRVQRKDLSYPHLAGGNVQDGEIKKLDVNDSYDEMVLEMEKILLDSGNCHGPMYVQGNQGYISRQPCHIGDGSSVASTSATDEIFSPVQGSSKIDRVEVVGAKQKKGDVSFGERLVGVREYTIYQIHVWSDTNEWKVERRYRDFFALYRQLKALFTGHGLILPSAWSSVDQDSRKIFGNVSPNVVLERSILIEDCLRSILNIKYPFGTPNPLILFLTPGKAMLKYGLLQSLVPQYLQKFAESENLDCGEPHPEHDSLLGMTISLIVEIKPHKSLRQLLEIQHYTCAGCHKRLDAGKTLFRELVQTFGWNRPRFCEYTGQLFCASCHTNDTSVLPARVLHHWDFTLYPISQLAKAYLESIYDQPMLCVSAVNPFLFSKVPSLLHVMDFRRKIGAMLPSVTCPFRSSIQKSLGFRRYFLESNDFFALRDLVDLSKGPFAALPAMVENMSNLILEHITQQCLVCYDSGVPCAARQACYEPSSLIFPFQEAEAEKCTACGSIFHKACYVDLLGCSCRNNAAAITKRLGPAEPIMMGSHREHAGSLENSIRPLFSNSATGFFTSILTRVKPDKIWKTKNSSPVILMGSLPSSSL